MPPVAPPPPPRSYVYEEMRQRGGESKKGEGGKGGGGEIFIIDTLELAILLSQVLESLILKQQHVQPLTLFTQQFYMIWEF